MKLFGFTLYNISGKLRYVRINSDSEFAFKGICKGLGIDYIFVEVITTYTEQNDLCYVISANNSQYIRLLSIINDLEEESKLAGETEEVK